MFLHEDKTMEQIVALSKSRGFVFPGSEIYGGLSNTWDYGPLGVELKNNIKKAWWKKFIQESPYNVGLDAAIFMNPRVWQASGHLDGFSDPLMDCRSCNMRYRADTLIEKRLGHEPAGWSMKKMQEYIKEEKITCPNCDASDFTDIREFNLMFQTYQGVTSEAQDKIYLRPETAQGIFVNFANVQRSARKKVPFGIGQIGKSFRNEITPGNFIFRTREFEQMELQFFCKPGSDDEWFDFWKKFSFDWLVSLGLKEENLRNADHAQEALSHYSKATTDIEYLYPSGWGELWGVANRTDYDIKQHNKFSDRKMDYFDPDTDEHYIPYVIEPSLGVDRMFLAILTEAYDVEVLEKGERNVLRFHPALAPYKAAILPLSKKLDSEAREVFSELSKHFMVTYDDASSIGRRYRRQDEIGTPFCVTYDFESKEDNSVTVRERDSMEQIRLPINEVSDYINKRLVF